MEFLKSKILSNEMIAKRIKYNDKIYYQSFNGHIEDSLKILKAYFEKKGTIINSFCERWNLDQNSFNRNLFLTVALHDIGKLTREFQNNIKDGKRSHKCPHPLFGIPILLKIPFDTFENFPLPLLTIFGHHSQLHLNIYDSNNIKRTVNYLDDEIKTFISKEIRNIYRELNFYSFFDLPELSFNGFEKLNRDQIINQFRKFYNARTIIFKERNSPKYKIKSIFTYMLSVLQLCDDYSSAHFNKYIEQNKPECEVFDSVMTNVNEFVFDIQLNESELKEKLFNGFTPYSFQEELYKKATKYSFLFAPCGRGKTEASLWWAFKLKKKLKREKIIFALPTQVTCNAMYDRMLDKENGYNFGEKNVGLFHGKSLIALKYRKEKNEVEIEDAFSINDDIDFKPYDILKDDVFKGNVFFKPITITTIDHLAYAFVHGFSQADFACGNLQNSIIIFDEVHYYEEQTLNILLRLFLILRKMEIPHLLMTGTAPEFLMKEIEKKYEIVKDDVGLKYQPFIIAKSKEEDLINSADIYESIMNDYMAGKNTFVILNQVEWAQNFYKDLKEYLELSIAEPNILLYHSRFIHKDRVKKEKEIKEKVKQKPCILVTTQVIEISLDISCDVMYTTIAPPDAIGQRAGRLNRSGKYFKNGFSYKLKLFQVENHYPYTEKIIKDSWKYFDENVYSYETIKSVCDRVYKDNKLSKDKKYQEFFKNNILFGDYYKEITCGDDEGKRLKIRPDDYQRISVVPSSVFDEAEKLVTENKALWTEYEVKIPFYKLKQDINEYGQLYNFNKNEKYNIWECKYDYDYSLGVQFDKYYSRTVIL